MRKLGRDYGAVIRRLRALRFGASRGGFGALALGVALVLAGCGSSGTSSKNGHPASSGNHRIGFLLGVQNNPFYETEACWAQAAAKQQGYTVEFQAPASFDVTLEDQVTQALASTRPAGLIVDPVFGNEQAPTISQVIASGIPVATVEEPISVPGQVLNVTAEHQILGKMAADLMARALHGSGQVYVSDYQAGVQSTDARREGFLAELKKYPGLKYVGNTLTGADITKAAQAMAAEIQRYPNLKGIFGTNLYSIQGDLTTLKQDGKLNQVTTISTDVLPIEVGWLRAHEVYALIAQKPGVIAALAIDAMINHLEGKRKATNTTYYLPSPFVTVTRQNMTEPSIEQYLYTSGSCSAIPGGIPAATLRSIQSEVPGS